MSKSNLLEYLDAIHEDLGLILVELETTNNDVTDLIEDVMCNITSLQDMLEEEIDNGNKNV